MAGTGIGAVARPPWNQEIVEGEMEKLVLVSLMIAIICALAEWAPQPRPSESARSRFRLWPRSVNQSAQVE
jgi:hypothetical protein